MRLLYFSPVAWDSYEQRPHYVVRDFLASGGAAVVWINPYPARLPGWGDLGRRDRRDPPMSLARPEGLSVIDPGGLPVDPLPGGAWINARLFWGRVAARLAESGGTAGDTIIGVGRPTALARWALERVPAAYRFYDAMDDFPEFYRGRSRAFTRRMEHAIAQRVDRIFAASSRLVEKFAAGGAANVTWLPNAYDMDLLPAHTGARPASPSFGFVGCMGGWFDWDVVARLADTVRPIPIALVGPLASRPPRRLRPNVTIDPPCSQAEGVRRLSGFSAGLIPFARSALTAGVDPIKYYQYRAFGLPVLSTRFGEMARRGAADGVFFLDDAAGIRPAVRSAFGWQPTSDEVMQFRAGHTWSARFKAARIWTG